MSEHPISLVDSSVRSPAAPRIDLSTHRLFLVVAAVAVYEIGDPSSLLCCLIRVRCKVDGCPGIVSAYPQAGALGAFKISRATTPHTCMSNNHAVRVPAAQAKELLAPVRDLMGEAKASAIVKHIRTVHGGQLGIRTVPAELRSLLISACRPYHRWRRRSE